MRSFLENRAAVAALTFALVFAGYGLTQTSAGMESAPSAKNTAAKRSVLPDFATLAEKLGPVVVNISATQTVKETPFEREDPLAEFWRRLFGDRNPSSDWQQVLGSGFIIDDDGTILTNNHVIEDAQKIVVTLCDNDQQFVAQVIGRDERTDLAVIKINVNRKLPVAPLGDSDQLKVGDWIAAMGSPFGLRNTITAGIVSAKNRQLGAKPYDDFIQTDASINPGNSGGPLVNMQGEVVGINTVIFSRRGANIGIGFAIPINMAKELLPELRTKGRVTRGWLGVATQKITPDIAEALGMEGTGGALVVYVVPGSSAERAGIRVRDVIIEYAGKPVKDPNDLSLLVARSPVETHVSIHVLRNHKKVSLQVMITELKDEEGLSTALEKEKQFGLTVQNVTPEISQNLGLQRGQGVIIIAVERGSPADSAGFRRGDVVLQIDDEAVHDLSDYRRAITGLKKAESSLFLVQRGDSVSFLALKVTKEKAPS
ncbi:MAG TPA: DegQ family serine endoprotease [Candidatus Acidoferrales bacterium]|nr:DegQ family serine endoprotease [Candidatus Acidoferrales bacterium]